MPEGSSNHTSRNDSGEIATSTLAEIYAQQGLLGRALSIYRRMLARAPEDVGIADRIRSLEVRLAETGPEPQAEPAAGPPAARERLPWDPPEAAPPPMGEAADPEGEAAAPFDPTAPTMREAAAPADPAGEAGTVTLETEPEPAPVDSPRRAERMDAKAFRSWLDAR